LRRLHNQQQHEVMHVFSRLFGADGKLNTCVVPGHCDAVLRVFDIAPGRARKSTDHTFTSRAEFVKVLQTLRRGARGVVLETPERERKLAELHAQSLAAGGPWRLMPGARPWLLELVDKSTGEPTPLCDRAGPHTGRLAASVGEALPLQPRAYRQPAQTEREKEAAVRRLQVDSEAAQRALVVAAVAATVAAAEAAAAVAALIELAEKRGQQLDSLLLPDIATHVERLRELGLGDQAEAFVAARLRLTKHDVRPDVKGGWEGGAPLTV